MDMAVDVRRERPDRDFYETVVDQVALLSMPEWKKCEKLG